LSAHLDLTTSQQANLLRPRWTMTAGQGLFKDVLIPKHDFDQRKTAYFGAALRSSLRLVAFSL